MAPSPAAGAAEKRPLLDDELPSNSATGGGRRIAAKTWRELITTDKLVLLFAVPLLAAVAFFAMRGPTSSLIRSDDVPVHSAPVAAFSPLECSGHGLLMANRACFCDAGFGGRDCSSRVPLDQPSAQLDQKTKDDPDRRRTIAMFVDAVTPKGIERDNNVYLAKALARSGLDVTVFTNTPLGFADKHITVSPMPAMARSTEGTVSPVTASVAVYQYLASHPFDAVYFDANAYVGFHTVSAKALGSRCTGAHILVGVTQPPASSIAGADMHGDQVAGDYMRQRTIELADRVVFANGALRELDLPHIEARKSAVHPLLTSGAHRKITHPLAKRSASASGPQPIHDLVFVGDMSVEGGLVAFVEALDRLHATSAAPVHVTFFGPVGDIEGTSAIDFVRARSILWPKYALEIREASLKPLSVLAFLTEPGHQRAAVIPAAVAHAPLAQELMMTGTPVILGKADSANDVMATVDDLFAQMARAVDHGVNVARLSRDQEDAQRKFVDEIVALAAAPAACAMKTAPTLETIAVVLAHPRGAKFSGLQKAIKALEDQHYPALEVVLAADPANDNDMNQLLALTGDAWEMRGWKLAVPESRSANALAFDDLMRLAIRDVSSEYVVPMTPAMLAKANMITLLSRGAALTKADVVLAGVDSTTTHHRTLPLGAGMLTVFGTRSAWNGVAMIRARTLADLGGYSSDIRGLLAKATLQHKRIYALPEVVAFLGAERAFVAPGKPLDALQYMDEHVNEAPAHERAAIKKVVMKRRAVLARRQVASTDSSTDSTTDSTATDSTADTGTATDTTTDTTVTLDSTATDTDSQTLESDTWTDTESTTTATTPDPGTGTAQTTTTTDTTTTTAGGSTDTTTTTTTTTSDSASWLASSSTTDSGSSLASSTTTDSASWLASSSTTDSGSSLASSTTTDSASWLASSSTTDSGSSLASSTTTNSASWLGSSTTTDSASWLASSTTTDSASWLASSTTTDSASWLGSSTTTHSTSWLGSSTTTHSTSWLGSSTTTDSASWLGSSTTTAAGSTGFTGSTGSTTDSSRWFGTSSTTTDASSHAGTTTTTASTGGSTSATATTSTTSTAAPTGTTTVSSSFFVASTTTASSGSSSSSSSSGSTSTATSTRTTTTTSTASSATTFAYNPSASTTAASAPTPTLVVTAPTLLGGCDTSGFTIDLSKSSSSGGGTIRYLYYYSGNNTAAATAFAAANQTQSYVILPATAVTASTPLRVGVAVSVTTTAFGTSYTSVQTITVTRSASSAIPQLTLTNPTFQGRLVDGIAQYLAVSFPGCAGIDATTVPFNYTWAVTDPSNAAVNIANMGGSVSGANLYLPFNKLSYGTYTITGSTVYNGVTYTISAPFTVVSTPLVAYVTSGSAQQLSTSRANTLSVGIQDDDNMDGSKSYSYIWMACDANGASCQSIGAAQSVVIPANTLTPSTTYTFVCQVSDASTSPARTALATTKATTTTALVPKIVLYRWPASGQVSASQGMSTWAQVFDPDTGAVIYPSSYLWSISPNSASTITLTGTKRNYLVFGSDVLPQGQSITFRVTVTLANGVSSWADLAVQVASVPSGGSVALVNANPANMVNSNPASGVGFSDTFRIATTGWTGGVAPFTYTFGYVMLQGSIQVQNDMYLTNSPAVESITLPVGAASVYAVVTDALGSSVLVTQSVSIVQASGATNAVLLGTASSLVSQAQGLAVTNPALALTTLNTVTSITTALPAALTASDRTQVASISASVISISTIAMGNLLPSPQTAVRALNVLATINLSGASSSSYDSVMSLVDSTLSGVSVAVGGVKKSIEPRQAQSIGRALNNLISNLIAASGGSLRRRQTITTTQQARARAQVQALVLGSIAGATCSVSSAPTLIDAGTFVASGRRVVATGTDSGDSARTVGNFSLTLPSTLPAGCLDIQAINWQSLRGSANPSQNMLTNVLTVQAFNNGTTTALNTQSLNVGYTANVASVPSGSSPVCVYWSGTAWTSTGCTTTVTSSSQVSCNCPMYSDFSVQAQVNASPQPTTSTPTPTTVPGAGSNAGAIAGGVVGGLAVVGGGAGFMMWKRRQG